MGCERENRERKLFSKRGIRSSNTRTPAQGVVSNRHSIVGSSNFRSERMPERDLSTEGSPFSIMRIVVNQSIIEINKTSAAQKQGSTPRMILKNW